MQRPQSEAFGVCDAHTGQRLPVATGRDAEQPSHNPCSWAVAAHSTQLAGMIDCNQLRTLAMACPESRSKIIAPGCFGGDYCRRVRTYNGHCDVKSEFNCNGHSYNK